MKRKVGITIDPVIHRTGVKLAKKYKTSFSGLLELLVQDAVENENKTRELLDQKKENVNSGKEGTL
ncbi:hypothetical protein FOA22_25625 [Heyndrickxia oleronia]|uniref:hypothetical protein n=1 Tax=Heyndrickxia oleronia TaxID=38875 RepID=UPI0033395287